MDFIKECSITIVPMLLENDNASDSKNNTMIIMITMLMIILCNK